MATILYRKQHAEIGFAGSMTTILTWVTRSMKTRKIEDCQLQALLDENDTQSQKMLAKQLGFSSSHFHAATCHGEGSKRSENGCRMNWTIGRWSDAKTHAKFCLPDKKESRSCVGLWQAMKSGSIFRILNARNLGLIPPNHQHFPQDQIASDGRRCCAFGIKRVSSTTSC